MRFIALLIQLIVSSILIYLSNINLEMKFYSYSIKFIVCLIIFGCIFTSFLLNKKYKKLKKLFFILSCVINIFIFLYSILYKFQLLEYFKSVTKLKNLILSFGTVGIIIFILLEIGQVMLLPIPAIVLIICGNMIYGPFLTTIFCSIGIIIGSSLSFILGRLFGLKLVKMIVNEKYITRYNDIMNDKGKLLLSLAFLLPLFPDDILCLVAGISKMKFKDFFSIVSTIRPISVLFMCYFSGGKIIPFSGWGIYVWCTIAVLFLVGIIVYFIYRQKINIWINNKFKKNKKPSKI